MTGGWLSLGCSRLSICSVILRYKEDWLSGGDVSLGVSWCPTHAILRPFRLLFGDLRQEDRNPTATGCLSDVRDYLCASQS